ncbi:MAG: SWIM zinc finger family protein [Bacteroidaceae bacterium]|nr:SWIM zinc finger family protein [Bacteroidaceae bacterium]
MLTMNGIADNFYKVFKPKTTPKVRHSSAKHNGHYVLLKGTATGSNGMYTMEIELQKDELGKVNYNSPVSYIYCSCPAYQYYVQDPLAKQGSTYPGTGHVNKKINNPKQVAAPCKHLLAYINYLMAKGILNRVNMTAPELPENKG